MSFRDFFKDIFGAKASEGELSKPADSVTEVKQREADKAAQGQNLRNWEKADDANLKRELEADKKVLQQQAQRKIDKLDSVAPGWQKRAISADDREIMDFKKEGEGKKKGESKESSEGDGPSVPQKPPKSGGTGGGKGASGSGATGEEKGGSVKVEKGDGKDGAFQGKQDAKPVGVPDAKPAANPSPVTPAKQSTVDLSPVKPASAGDSNDRKIGQNVKPVALPDTKPPANPSRATPGKPSEVDLSPVKGAAANTSNDSKSWQEREDRRRAQPAESDDYRARGRMLGDTQEKMKALQAVKQKQGNMHKCNTDVKIAQTTQGKSNSEMVKGKWTAKVVKERQVPKPATPGPRGPRK